MTTGGCLCGTVMFEVRDFSTGIFKCHCSKCRKAFGGASSAAALAGEDGFQWLSGSDRIRHHETGSGFTRYFCDNCGSILPQHLPAYGSYWIPVGLLDADPGIRLTTHIHVKSKAAWELLDPDTTCLDQGFDL